MGNTVIKDEANLLEKLSESSSIVSPAIDSSILSLPEDSAEFLSKVEDAIVTDSTTVSVTEYDSANDNDVASNRLSSCTDISCDFPIDTSINSLSEEPKSDQVSSSLCVNSSGHLEFINSVADGFFTRKLTDVSRTAPGNENTYTIDDDDDSFFSLISEDGLEIEDLPLDENQSHPPARRPFAKNYRESKREKPIFPIRVRKKTKKPISRSEKPLKAEFRKLPVVCKDLLILHYEQKTREKTISPKKNVNILEGNSRFETCAQERPNKLCAVVGSNLSDINTNLIRKMMYPAYFRCNEENVLLTNHHCTPYKLEKFLVRRILVDKDFYVNILNGIEFLLNNYEDELWFAAHVVKKVQVQIIDGFLRKKVEKKKRTCIVAPYQTEMDEGFDESRSEFKGAVNYDQVAEIDADMNGNENVSEAGPTTAANIDNLNNIPLLNDSTDLEFISKIGGTGLVAENLRKQSLYVKFDPLVANESSANFNGDVTFSSNDIANLSLNDHDNTLTANLDSSRVNSSLEVTDAKSNEHEPVGKLISVTPNKSPRKTTPKSSPRYSDADSEDLTELKSLLMKQMKREEAFKEEIECLRRENEHLALKLQNSENEIGSLRNTVEASQENEKKLKNELAERIKSKQQLSFVMEEYEKTISQMVARKEDEKVEFEAMIRKVEAERDSAMQHLNNLENAFNDVHQKYERGKIVNEALKKNEDILKKSLSEYEVTVKTVENKYELLKSHATSQLDKANQELEMITQTYEKEQAKLKAMLRKSEIQINSLKNALDQKTKENQELTAVCDELIVKLSNHSDA